MRDRHVSADRDANGGARLSFTVQCAQVPRPTKRSPTTKMYCSVEKPSREPLSTEVLK